jgi:FkbM family methyltransferase
MDKQYKSIIFDKNLNIEESYKLLDEIQKKLNEKQNIKSDINYKIDRPIILYGAGNLGKMAKRYFDKLEVPILFIVDSNTESINDPFWDNIKIFKPNEIPLHTRLKCITIVCIVTRPFMEIYNILNTFAFKNIIPFYDITLFYQDKHPLNNGWMINKLDIQDIIKIRYILSKLKDDISRSHHLQFVAWHCLREEWIFKNVSILNDNRYFIPEIISILNDNEIFVDIGAHHGEVTLKFMDIVYNKFDNILLIEPDRDNIDNLVDNIKENIHNYNISLIPIAIGEKNEEQKNFYCGLDYASQFSNISNDYVRVKKIDDLNINPTFIKIHTEGNEIDIINGGIKTINKNRPIITTTYYHNSNGLWKSIYQLMTTLKDYIFYTRLHSWCGTGAVIYAIPKERSK